MAQDNLTLVLDGEVTLDEFATAVKGLKDLVNALSREAAKKERIKWVVADLESGSAFATIAGRSDAPQSVEAVVHAYEAVGVALQRHTQVPYSRKVREYAENIYSVLERPERSVTSLRFETPLSEVLVTPENVEQPTQAALISAFGALEGRVQTLTNRGGLRFTLYDALYDKPISCYLTPGLEDAMRSVWGRRAVVEGWISRDPETGRPLSIRQIVHIEPLPEVSTGAFRAARGLVSFTSKQLKSEDLLRQVRDAE